MREVLIILREFLAHGAKRGSPREVQQTLPELIQCIRESRKINVVKVHKKELQEEEN
jgi:hypothetical protein